MSIRRKNILATSNKHLILDVSTIINLWFGGECADQTEKLIDEASAQGTRLWVVATSLATLEYVAHSRLRKSGVEPETAARIVRRLMDDLFNSTGVLTNYGFEQAELYRAARDYAEAQIVAAARSLAGARVCIVTENEDFDTLGEVSAKNSLQAFAWLRSEGAAGITEQPIPFIDLKTQQAVIRPLLERKIETVLRHGQYIMGPEINQLEELLAEYVGVNHCIAVSDGTKALLIAMMALDIKPGDEIITTPFTFIATGEMIALLGANPVFVDIDPRTYNIDPNKIEAAITPKSKAIMPVSLYGQCADFDAINAIAAKHGLPVIEDGAQSFGATYKGSKSCGLTSIGSASFFPSKPLGCYGDGGALFTNDDGIAKAMREIRLHGQDHHYHHPRVGINGRMDTIQAAVLQAKMDIFPGEVEARQRIGSQYGKLLGKAVVTPYIEPFNTSVYAQYTILVDNRATMQQSLKEQGIPTAVHYPLPLNIQPVFEYLNKPAGSYPVSEEIAKRAMSLPMSPYLTDAAINKIANAVLGQL